nr:hypothetical protein [Tanacetum cinerariifolium]
VLSTPVEDKPFKSEFTSLLVMTCGCEIVIGFVLALTLTVLGTFFASLEVLSGLILNIHGAITLSLFTPFDSCGIETEFEVPADWSRSVPADWSRSVPADWSRSVPAARTRSVPAARTRSVPTTRTRSVPAIFARSVPTVFARSVPREEY